MPHTNRIAAPAQKVVVVNGNTEVLEMLEPVLDAGHYDMVFVESSDSAYSEIRKVLPDLVVLCARFEQPDSFQLLTMLRLDAATRDIPVLTCATETDEQSPDMTISQLAEEEENASWMTTPGLRMN
jgi:PleD family two-component response regulator